MKKISAVAAIVLVLFFGLSSQARSNQEVATTDYDLGFEDGVLFGEIQRLDTSITMLQFSVAGLGRIKKSEGLDKVQLERLKYQALFQLQDELAELGRMIEKINAQMSPRLQQRAERRYNHAGTLGLISLNYETLQKYLAGVNWRSLGKDNERYIQLALTTYVKYGNAFSVGDPIKIVGEKQARAGRSKPAAACTTPLRLDLDAGTLDGATPLMSQDEAKKLFPCYTGVSNEGEKFNYGGGVFYINHDMYLYTYNDFIEVREDFDGIVSPTLIGADSTAVEKLLGKSGFSLKKQSLFLYPKKYGCLRVETENSIVIKVGVHYKPCDAVAELLEWH